jgi:pseudouridine-5'-phosphate glycosidase
MIQFGPEVKEALASRAPVVALETSVVAQGLPRPINVEAMQRCEEAVREVGAVAAPIGVIDGRIWVGLTTAQISRLADDLRCCKVGARDLAPVIAKGGTGGTTVSATCAIAHSAGIRIFATGGIGGVHRGSEQWDVSQDLWAISRFSVAVVCAGAKSLLDLPRTLEVLEALGVPVIGVGTSELPSFYGRTSGLTLEHRVDDADEACRMMHVRLDVLGHGGLLFALPVPEAAAIPRAELEAYLEAALALAAASRIRGQQVTPFLLAEMARRSGGKTVEANLALLVNNARFAAQLAVADARSRSSKVDTRARR